MLNSSSSSASLSTYWKTLTSLSDFSELKKTKNKTLLSSLTSSESSMLYFVCFVCFIRKVHSHRHSTDNSPVAPPQGKASGPGSTAVTLSLSFRWSHGLNTNLPSPSRLSFRHCSFSMSMRWYSPYSRPLSAGSCSPAQPQPCPCPWPCPCPDIVEVRAGRKTATGVGSENCSTRPRHFEKWNRIVRSVTSVWSCSWKWYFLFTHFQNKTKLHERRARISQLKKRGGGQHSFAETHFCFLFIPISINCPYLESVCA